MQTNLCKKRSFSLFKVIIAIYLLIFALNFMLLGKTAIDCATDGLVVFRDTVMPAILPFAFAITFFNATIGKELTTIFTPLAKRLKFSPNGFYLYFTGIIGGSPLGISNAICALKNQTITKQETLQLICLTSVASPLLTITCVGKLTYGSFYLGVIFFLSQIFSAFFCQGILTEKVLQPCRLESMPLKESFDDYILSIVKSLATNCVLTVFFYTAISLTVKTHETFILFESSLLKGLLTGLFETNYGLEILSYLHSPLSYATANAVLTFGGLPLLIQTVVLTKTIKIRTAHTVFFKLTQSLICFLITFILTSFLFLLRLS